MKIVAISDTHGLTKDLKLPDGDVLVHAGDITGMGTMDQVIAANEWLGSYRHQFKHILLIPGNHDFLFEKDPSLAETLMYNAEVLNHKSKMIEDKLFFGSPYSPWYYDWAFNKHRGEEIKKCWNTIPEGTNVLITHGPPHGFLDATNNGTRHVGCEMLLQALERIKPQIHICGHIHEGYGTDNYGNIKLYNAAICDQHYRPINAPLEIEL